MHGGVVTVILTPRDSDTVDVEIGVFGTRSIFLTLQFSIPLWTLVVSQTSNAASDTMCNVYTIQY